MKILGRTFNPKDAWLGNTDLTMTTQVPSTEEGGKATSATTTLLKQANIPYAKLGAGLLGAFATRLFRLNELALVATIAYGLYTPPSDPVSATKSASAFRGLQLGTLVLGAFTGSNSGSLNSIAFHTLAALVVFQPLQKQPDLAGVKSWLGLPKADQGQGASKGRGPAQAEGSGSED